MATYQQVAQAQLRILCQAAGLGEDAERHESVRARLFQGWGDVEIPSKPGYLSAIGDDHSPFEYSLALGASKVELRLLIEAQGRVPGTLTNRAAALSLNERLVPYGANFARFERIRDLFLPDVPEGPFTLWHAVTFGASQPDFKIYLNPLARGAAHAWPIISEAMARLGMPRAARTLKEVAKRGSDLDEPNYFSLDLSKSSGARVKVYLKHPGASATDLERVLSAAPTYRKGDAAEFCRSMAGHVGPFMAKPATTCLSFVEGTDEPLGATMHLPIAHYLKNDAEVRRRLKSYLQTHRLPFDTYDRVLSGMSARALEDAAGIQSYASFRRERDGIRVTSYLSPELFRGGVATASHTRLKAVHPSQAPASEVAALEAPARRAASRGR